MHETEDPVQRSIREFREAFDSRPWIGVSRLAEVAQLRVLIQKYPAEARSALAELDSRKRGAQL
jgi:hypothetical protein